MHIHFKSRCNCQFLFYFIYIFCLFVRFKLFLFFLFVALCRIHNCTTFPVQRTFNECSDIHRSEWPFVRSFVWFYIIISLFMFVFAFMLLSSQRQGRIMNWLFISVWLKRLKKNERKNERKKNRRLLLFHVMLWLLFIFVDLCCRTLFTTFSKYVLY